MYIFIDGVNEVNAAKSPPVSIDYNFCITGCPEYFGGTYVNGVIDEVRLTDCSSGARYTTDFDPPIVDYTPTGPTIIDANTLGYWKMTEGKGLVAYDYSPNGNHGTLTATSSVEPMWWAGVK
jgi:hypothetical protein